jgi:hypothetical protein
VVLPGCQLTGPSEEEEEEAMRAKLHIGHTETRILQQLIFELWNDNLPQISPSLFAYFLFQVITPTAVTECVIQTVNI